MKVKIKSVNKKNDYYITEIYTESFYPDGKGGQLGDRGFIGNSEIKEVISADKLILSAELETDKEYDFNEDTERKEDISVQHTAQHVLSAVLNDRYNAYTESFRMSENYSTIDINKEVTDEELKNTEKIIFELIQKNIPVNELTAEKEEAVKLHLRKPISDKVTGKVRIIEIPGIDISACGGYHVKNISQLSIVKTIKKERVKGGLTRIYFLAGKRALDDYDKKTHVFSQLSLLLSCPTEEIYEKSAELNEKFIAIKNENKKLTENICYLIGKNPDEYIKEKNILFYPEDDDVAKNLFRFTDLNKYILITFSGGSYSIFSEKYDLTGILNKLKSEYSVKGGGNKSRINIKGEITTEILFEAIKK